MTDREKLIKLLNEAHEKSYSDADPVKPVAHVFADYLIANGVTVQQWVSAEDEKPKRRGHYFISYVFRCPDIRFYGEAMWHDDMEGNGYVTGPHFSNEGMDGMRVTHWMEIPRIPLSKPPKEG